MALCNIKINVDYVRIYIKNNSSALVSKTLYFAEPNSTIEIPIEFTTPIITDVGTVSDGKLIISTATTDITVTIIDNPEVDITITNNSSYISVPSVYTATVNTTAAIPFEYINGGNQRMVYIEGGRIDGNTILVDVHSEPVSINVVNTTSITVSVRNNAQYHVTPEQFTAQTIYSGETAVFDVILADEFDASNLAISPIGYIENSKLYVPTTIANKSNISVSIYRTTSDIVVVGSTASATTSKYTPFYCNGNYNTLSQFLYSSNTMINPLQSGDIISKIAFKKNSGSAQNIDADIYMLNSKKLTYGSSGTTPIPDTFTSTNKVFSGTISIPEENDWIEIPLDTPFAVSPANPFAWGVAVGIYIHSGGNLTELRFDINTTTNVNSLAYRSSSSTFSPEETYTGWSSSNGRAELPIMKVWRTTRISPDTPDA